MLAVTTLKTRTGRGATARFVALAATCLLAATAARANAASITVDRTDDPNPTQSACTTTASDCSLRGAVAAAAASGDTIVLTAANYAVTRGEIAIDKSLTITGQGANPQPSITGNDTERLFNIGATTAAVTVVIAGVKLTGGKAPDTESGGAIQNAATLTIDDATLIANKAGVGLATIGGGGPDAPPGSPGDGGSGGAISNSGTLTITDSLLTGNQAGAGSEGDASGQAPRGGVGGHGGAISSSGALTITNTTLTANTAGTGGQADIEATGGGGGSGGAISSTGTLTVTHSTLAANTAGVGGRGGSGTDAGSGGNGGDGGYGGNAYTSEAATISNSILVGGVAGVAGLGGPASGGPGSEGGGPGTAGEGANCFGEIAANAYSIAFIAAGDRGGCPATFGNANPLLGALASNGGPTQTMLPGAGSAAIDPAPAAPSCGTADQRGLPRPAGPCDVGAVEVQPAQDANDPDGDGVLNPADQCPNGATGPGDDPDADGCKNAEDPDDDNDGVPDATDACPTGTTGPGDDADGDGCKAAEDTDGDGTAPGDGGNPGGSGGSGGGGAAGQNNGTPVNPGQAGNAGPGAVVAISRRFTLKYSSRSKRLSGKLTSAAKTCASRQTVTVYRLTRAKARRVGTAKTTATGTFTLRKKVAAGRYQARATAQTATNCAAATSRTVTVR